jgi:hypothetical protein
MRENQDQALPLDAWCLKLADWARRESHKIRKDAHGVLLREDLPLLHRVTVAGAARPKDLAQVYADIVNEIVVVTGTGGTKYIQAKSAIDPLKPPGTDGTTIIQGKAEPPVRFILSPDLTEEQRATFFEVLGDVFEAVGGKGGLKIEGRREVPAEVREFAS